MPQANLKLSAHDRQVLDSIFNPLELTSTCGDVSVPADVTELVDVEPQTEATKASRELELEAVYLTEQGQLEQALKKFDDALELAPNRASVLNNRAQALRLVKRDEDALSDLNQAIELANEQLKTKCHAHCQRGILYRKLDNLEAARKDFEVAAQLGSKFAREQLVEINPFAALCNQMLRQAFNQLK
ncbi:tetratricopeptide repeat protein 36 homolog [Scaptodrosophila lebanonensis]|uniref:Tetratricopeptide repeat protein 36 homolog n=1 Tax=Drosophila lebanonensis TaxID=7225 RepID=A0A6J2T9J2_DROLE|nr:tetratricopeptide repeat protein 36 homolog [Scaptodrosophila lebanonensis]